MLADHPHQPLRQNAIQRRNEIVGLDAHVQEAADHVDHVVGVDGSENQVAGQRGVDGDLRCLRVADLAHHDLVRIVAQDGAQAAGERQPLLFVDRNLGDAANLILDRIFDGDDLVFVGLDLVQRRIERRGLAAAGRPGHQHHAVRLGDVAGETCSRSASPKPTTSSDELLEFLAHRLLVEHAQHRILAVDASA